MSLLRTTLLTLAAALASAAVPAAQDAAAEPASTMLRLRSGDVAFGQIVAHDPDGIRLRLLETGGEVELPWGYLDPNEANELRLAHGYVEASSEELLVDAERIELVNGREVVGRIVERTEREVWVKRAEGMVPIPVTQIRGAITTIQAPALDIFTKEELYQQKAFELQGRLGDEGRPGALAHDELAKHAERLLDYAHALEHYQRAAERDPSFDSERLAQAIQRATEKSALQVQIDHLSEIDLQRARKRYDRATALLNEFGTLYPKSPLLEDLAKLRDRVAKSQERDLREEVIARWHAWTVRLAREAARKPTFEEVQGYLDEKMSEDVAQKVRDDVQTIAPGIEVDAVRRIWGERKGGKYRSATYGGGTWLLGESAREELDQTKEEKKVEPEKGTQTEARKKLEDRIKRYLENQKLTRQAADAAEEDDPQAFWDGWNWSGRSQWVLAYYAEKSGDMKDLQSRFANCRECGGTGARDMLFTGSAASAPGQQAGEVLVPCPACHTIGIVRRIRYR